MSTADVVIAVAFAGAIAFILYNKDINKAIKNSSNIQNDIYSEAQKLFSASGSPPEVAPSKNPYVILPAPGGGTGIMTDLPFGVFGG